MIKIKFLTFLKSETFKYIVFGGLTTLVNFICFFIFFNILKLNLNFANFLSIIISIIFAFITNRFIVFSIKNLIIKDLIFEFFKFIFGRAFTMIIEILGVWIFVEIFILNEYFSKIILQIIIIILNYVISKFFVFKKNPLN